MAWPPIRAAGHPPSPPAGAFPAAAGAAGLGFEDGGAGCWSVLVENNGEEEEESALNRAAEEADQSVVIEDYSFLPPVDQQQKQHKQYEEDASLPPQPSPTPPPPPYRDDDNGNETNDEEEELQKEEEVGEWDLLPEFREASVGDDNTNSDHDDDDDDHHNRHRTKTPDTLPTSPSSPACSPSSSTTSSSSPRPSPTSEDWTDVEKDRATLPPSLPPASNSMVCWMYLDELGNEFAYGPEAQLLLEHEWRNGRDHAQLWVPSSASSSSFSSSSSSSSPSPSTLTPYIVHFASPHSNNTRSKGEEHHIQINRVTGTQRKVQRLTRGPRPPEGVAGAVRRMKGRLRKGKETVAALDAETILHFTKQQTSQAGRALRRQAPSKEQVATAALVVARTTVSWLDRAVRKMSTEVQHHRERQQQQQQQQYQEEHQQQRQQQQQQQEEEEQQPRPKRKTKKTTKSASLSASSVDSSPSPISKESLRVLAREGDGKEEEEEEEEGEGGEEVGAGGRAGIRERSSGEVDDWEDGMAARMKIRQGPLLDLGEEN